MKRERALKVVLVVVGLLFCAAVYPLVLMARQDPALAMMMSLYATLGVFLLLASRNPSAHRSLIAFTAWSSFAHATVMAVQAFLSLIARRELRWIAKRLNFRAFSDHDVLYCRNNAQTQSRRPRPSQTLRRSNRCDGRH